MIEFDNDFEHIDNIIPDILEQLEKLKNKKEVDMTHREYIEKLARKQEQLTELSNLWETLMRQIKYVEIKSNKTLAEFKELLSQAKLVSGDFTPNDIINKKGEDNVA